MKWLNKTLEFPSLKEANPSETCVKIANDAVQIHGGYGYSKDYPDALNGFET